MGYTEMYLLKLPDWIQRMSRPLPTHATGKDLIAQEVPVQGAAASASRRMLQLLLLSKNSSASLMKRARAVLIMKGMRSTPMLRSCST